MSAVLDWSMIYVATGEIGDLSQISKREYFPRESLVKFTDSYLTHTVISVNDVKDNPTSIWKICFLACWTQLYKVTKISKTTFFSVEA